VSGLAPDVFALAQNHLQNVRCLDDDYKAVVAKLACNASNLLLVIQTVATELLKGDSVSMSLSTILGCIRMCSARNTPVPPFLVEFRENLVQSWSSQLISSIRSNAGTPFNLSDRIALADALRSALQVGLCHRRHVTVVDSGCNPNWLCEYVRCICMIWKDGNGAVTPASIQYMRKLASCTTQNMSMICEYALLCVKESKAIHLSLQFGKMHNILIESLTNCGLSNSAAHSCIRSICFDEQSLDTLVKVETVLSDVWDLILNPSVEAGKSIALPGIAGSHVAEFYLPRQVVSKGSPCTIVHCINSALPLSKINPPVDDQLMFMPSSMVVRKMCKDVCACLLEMCATEKFGGRDNSGCCPDWWREYKLCLANVGDGVCCNSLGVRTHPGALLVDSSSSDSSSDTLSELTDLCVRRSEYAKAQVSKVIMAGSIFDCVFSCAMKPPPLKITMDSVSVITDAMTGQAKRDKSLAGRVFVDIARIITSREMHADVVIDSQLIAIKSKKAAVRVMNVLIEYMNEYSKSRRKRKDETLIRRNARPCVDNRLGGRVNGQ